MKSENIHFPVETIRSALSKFNKKNNNSDSSKKVRSLHNQPVESGPRGFTDLLTYLGSSI